LRLERLRAEVADALRRIAAGGLVVGTAGNVSARDPASGLVVVSPTSLPYGTLRAEDVCLVDPSGRRLEGPAPSVELPGHLAILRARPDVGAVVHTHSRRATALARTLEEIPANGDAIPVCPYAASGEAATGEAVLAAAGGGWAVVMRDHGPFCLGRDLAEAVARAFAVEEAALSVTRT
jgi:L-ribulose-5-phosphate 4-epimerase